MRSTVSSSVVSDSESHRRVGKLPGSYSFTVPVYWIHFHVSGHSWFTYLSSSIIFTAGNEYVQSSRTWACQGVLQGVHRSREPGCNKHRVNNTGIDLTYHYSARGDHCHDQCGARSGSLQLVNSRNTEGKPELIIIVTIAQYEPAVPVMSPHCTTQHPTINMQAL